MTAIGKITVHAASAQVIVAIQDLANRKGWRCQLEQDGKIRIRTTANLLSWGEDIFVRITTSGTTTTVTAESAAIAQLIDWGKPQQNVTAILTQVAALGDVE